MELLKDEEILSVIEEYIENESKYAILIDGDWGSGKTYFIKNIVEPHLNEKHVDFGYVSLYGISSKEEINLELKKNIVEQKGKILNLSSNSKIEEYVLIFDDLERCNLDFNIIFGYINNFLEHKKNKCIIVTNQKESIRKIFRNNIELKYLVLREFDFFDSNNRRINDIIDMANRNNFDNKVIEKVKNLFLSDLSYKQIKEKVVGKEIAYKADIENIVEELSIKIENLKTRDILNKNSKKISDIMEKYNHNNIRTLNIIIEYFNNVTKAVLNGQLKDDEDIDKILTQVLIYLTEEMTKVKIGEEISVWDYKNEYFLDVEGSKFKFIDDYILTGKIDFERTIEVIVEYSKELKSEISVNENDPVKILREKYFKLEDYEIEKCINKIYTKLKQNIYDIPSYSKILHTLLVIKKLELCDFNLDDYIQLMEKNIKNDSQNSFLEKGINIKQKEISEKYNMYMDRFIQLLDKKAKNNIRINVNSLITEEDGWGQKLYDFFYRRNFNKDIFGDIDLQKIIQVMKVAKNEDIYNFKMLLYEGDFLAVSNEEIQKWINEFEKIYDNEKRKSQKLNIGLILDYLKEYQQKREYN